MTNESLLPMVLDSWDRNHRILLNLLHAVPERGLDVRAMEGSPSVVQMFHHMHFVRLVFIAEDAPEFGGDLPETEWNDELNRTRLETLLNASSACVRDVLKAKLEQHAEMDLHYDNPLLFVQHMIWHEGYHHGQIKLALKLAGMPIADEAAGPLTWGVWMDKKAAG